MGLVQFALRRPLSVVVAIVGIVIGAVVALGQMPRDIFPPLGVPTIYVAQPYGGMDPAQMEGYLTYYLRVSLPLHHGHRARRVAVDPGRGAAQAAVPPRHGHVPGDVRDSGLRKPGARVHAARHGAAVRDALRRRERAGGRPGIFQRDADGRARCRTWR